MSNNPENQGNQSKCTLTIKFFKANPKTGESRTTTTTTERYSIPQEDGSTIELVTTDTQTIIHNTLLLPIIDIDSPQNRTMSDEEIDTTAEEQIETEANNTSDSKSDKLNIEEIQTGKNEITEASSDQNNNLPLSETEEESTRMIDAETIAKNLNHVYAMIKT